MKYTIFLLILGCSLGGIFLLNQDKAIQSIEIVEELSSTGNAVGEVINKQQCANEDLSCERVWRMSHNLIDTRGPRNDPKKIINPEVKNWFEYQYTGYLYTGNDGQELLVGWENVLKTQSVDAINKYLKGLMKKGLTMRLMAPNNGLDLVPESYVFLGVENLGTGYVALVYDDNIYQGPGDTYNLIYLDIVYDLNSQKMILNNAQSPAEDFWVAMNFPKEITCINAVCRDITYGLVCDEDSAYDIHSPCLQAMRDLLKQGKQYINFGEKNNFLLQFFPSSLSDL